MKRLTFSLCVAALTVFASAASAEILIKFSHVVSADTPKGRGAEIFKQKVDERLAGKVRVEVYPSSQLYNDNDVLTALLLGDAQMAAPSLSKFGKYTRSYGVFDLPFLFKNTAAVECFTEGPKGKELLKAMEDKGYTGLAYWLNGMKQISANTPLLVPTDAEGLKFRIMTSDVLEAQFEALEANPQKMAFAEVYNSLQTGVIDGQENTWSNIYSKKFFEVQEHFTESNHGVLEYLVVTSTEFWNSLPDDIRAELEAILTETTAEVTEIALAKAEEDKQKVVDSGATTVHQIDDAQLAQWQEAMKPVWDEFEGEIGKDVIDAAIACNG